MKKIFTLALALLGLASLANAATIDDLQVCKHSYVLVGDDWTNNGTEKIAKNTLFGDGFFFTTTGHDKATNKGTVDLSSPDGMLVTEEIAAKYAEYGAHLNSLRLKTTQDHFIMKVTAKSKIIIFYNNNNADRYPVFAKDKDQKETWEPDFKSDTFDGKSARIEWTAPDDVTVYIGANNQIFISYVIVEANEAPGTPTVKVGDQTYEGGLWFREVTCKANDATEEGSDEKIPTIVTYTTDGTMPTAASPVYTQPIKCYKDMTVKFQAFLDFGDGKANADFICDGADNEGIVSFSFDAPAIEADGATFTINSPYAEQNGTNFYKLNDGDEVQGNGTTLTESATVTAFTKITNGDYATFTSKNSTKDIYVLNPIKEKKVIAVTAGEAVLDEEATASSTTGEVYKVEGGEISAEKSDFFVKNLTFKVEKNADYQVPVGQEVYIQMSNTNITFFVAEGDSVDVKVICTKNSCKNIDADDAEDGSQVNDRKCFVNVSGTNYCLKDEEGNETNDLKLYPNANEFSFGLKGAEGGSYFTFQKYSGTGNIMISSIEFTPAAAEPAETETVLWEGNALVNGWADQPFFLSDGGKELTDNNAKAGDRIRIYASAPANTWQVELFNGHWDGMVERFSAVALTEEDGSPRESSIFDLDALGYFEYTITDTFLTTNTVAQGWGGTFLLNGDGNLTVTKVTLVQGGASGIETIKAVNVKNGAVYNLSGQKVDASYKGVVIKNGKKMLQK